MARKSATILKIVIPDEDDLPQEEIGFDVLTAAMGCVLVATSDVGVVAILIGDDPERLGKELQDRFPDAAVSRNPSGVAAVVTKVARYLDRPRGTLDLPLDIRGTDFQRRVWNAMRAIPAGETSTYAEVARRIGMPRAARAVGNACGANNLAFVVPCHRVLRAGGQLSWGESWGRDRQEKLLALEAAGTASYKTCRRAKSR